MAVVLGTNAGFVSAAPVADPGGTNTGLGDTSRAVKDTSPAVLTKITEVGWWCDNATPNTNFEVGLYSHDAGNDVPLNRLYVDNTNAKGTDAGWKTVAVDWDIVPETVYWIAVQLDGTLSKIDYINTGGRTSLMTYQASLANPWIAAGTSGYIMAIYAVVESGVTYSELSGTIAAESTVSGKINTKVTLSGTIAAQSMVSGNIDTTAIYTLSGTIAVQSGLSGNLGSASVSIDIQTSFIKRLVVAGKDCIYYEDI